MTESFELKRRPNCAFCHQKLPDDSKLPELVPLEQRFLEQLKESEEYSASTHFDYPMYPVSYPMLHDLIKYFRERVEER